MKVNAGSAKSVPSQENRFGRKSIVAPKSAGEALAHRAVHAVAADHQIGLGKGAFGRDLVLEAQDAAERFRPALQNAEERGAGDRRKSVSGRFDPLAAEPGLDLPPGPETPPDLGGGLGIGVAEEGQRLVGEDDAEAEGVARPVALADLDLDRRKGPLHEDAEVEPRRSAADRHDAHGGILCGGSHRNRPSRRRLV